MEFIPIDAKADLQGKKKGKITPSQHAILNAWCLAGKTGILDFPQDHTAKGRCETDTLNITNIQKNETEIIFNKGYLVICGRLVECEDGTKFTFKTPITGKETGRIIARFSLGASGDEEFKIIQKTGSLIQQDLNDNPVNGEYELELYSYEAKPTSVILTRTQPYVPDIGGKISQFEASLKDEGKPLHGYDDSKGTIENRLVNAETRLTNLGFRSGVVTFAGVDYGSNNNTDASSNGVFRLGNFVLGNVRLRGVKYTPEEVRNYFTVGSEVLVIKDSKFFPKTRKQIPCILTPAGKVGNTDSVSQFVISLGTNGVGAIESMPMGVSTIPIWQGDVDVDLIFGYESLPIN